MAVNCLMPLVGFLNPNSAHNRDNSRADYPLDSWYRVHNMAALVRRLKKET